MKGAIEELYKEKGYRFAQVSYTLEDIALGQKRAVYTIDEGDKVKIGDIDFDGNTVYGDRRLRLTMKKTKESGLISRISKKDIYNPANVEEDLDKVRELYKKAGYKDILLGKPELDVKAKRPGAAEIADQKRRLEITIPVEEGERWKLGTIEVEGNKVFKKQVLLAQFDEQRGGWLRSKTVDDATENIKKPYSSIGYIFANVELEMIERENNVADIVVKIDESDQFRIGKIEFQGNTKTRDKVLRRELMVQEGLTMNMTGVQNSLLKIRQLNYFKLNEEEPVKFDFDAEKKTVDLLIQGEEAGAHRAAVRRRLERGRRLLRPVFPAHHQLPGPRRNRRRVGPGGLAARVLRPRIPGALVPRQAAVDRPAPLQPDLRLEHPGRLRLQAGLFRRLADLRPLLPRLPELQPDLQLRRRGRRTRAGESRRSGDTRSPRRSTSRARRSAPSGSATPSTAASSRPAACRPPLRWKSPAACSAATPTTTARCST